MINSPLIVTKEERLKQSLLRKDISRLGLLRFARNDGRKKRLLCFARNDGRKKRLLRFALNDGWPKKSLQNFAGFLVVLKQSIIAQ